MINEKTKDTLKNIGFAVLSLIALEFIFWVYTTFLYFIVQVVVFNLSPIFVIFIFLLLGGLIFGFIRMIAVGLSMLYGYICKLATHEKFVIVWTDIWVAVAVILNVFRIWSTSEFLLQGFLGIVGLIIITVNLAFLGITLCKTTATAIHGESTEQ